MIGQQRGDHLRLARARRSGDHRQRRAQPLHHRLPLLGVERQHFQNGTVLGGARRLAVTASSQPCAQRRVADSRFIELHQLAQLRLEAVSEGRARSREQHGAVVNAGRDAIRRAARPSRARTD